MLVLSYNDGERIRGVIGYEGENGIKADTWYRVNGKGELEECQDHD